MSNFYERIGQKGLFLLDAENAHSLSTLALKTGLTPHCHVPYDKRIAQNIAGIDVPNPLGLAAGYDKNAEVFQHVLKLGFGYVEIGTVTPRPQSGNPKPRIFRLPEDKAVINRLGFNNAGHSPALNHLKTYQNSQRSSHKNGIVGVNIGANKDSEDRNADYVTGVRVFYDYADYLTVNVSSPNTPGLRGLQDRESLAELLTQVMAERDALAQTRQRIVPIFLKIAPDLSETALEDIAEEVLAKKVDGIIISNTTLSRSNLKNQKNVQQAGGLSGAPVFLRSNIVLAKMRRFLGKDVPIIGVGGIDDTKSAVEKIKAGADLLQLYTGLIYKGPTLPADIVKGMIKICDRDNLSHILDVRDSKLAFYADQDIPE